MINLAGGLSLGVYMLVVYPVHGEHSLLLEQTVGLGAVALFNVAAGLSAYRTASPWWASMRAWLSAGGAPAAGQCHAVLALPWRYARMTAVRWLAGMVVFGAAELTVSRSFAIEVTVATALAALTATAAVAVRPASAVATVTSSANARETVSSAAPKTIMPSSQRTAVMRA